LFVLGIALATLVLLPVALASQGEHSGRRMGPLYPLAWACISLGLLAHEPRSLSGRLLAPAVGLVLVSNLLLLGGLISSWDRPSVPLSPWVYFAVPTEQARDRTEIGVPQLAADQVYLVNQTLGELLSESVTGGADEVRGLGRAFAGRGTFLKRPYPGCPDEADADIMELWLVSSRTEAAAVGRGLGIRCPEDRARVLDVCSRLSGEAYRRACRQAAG
jgi:hypothetical protein